MFDSFKVKAGTICALASMGAMSAFATETVTLPETGVDVAGYAGAAITALGSVVAVAIGGYVAFLLVRKGLSWIRKI